MKLSADPESPDYFLPNYRDVRVLLDGLEMKYVLELDTDEGWIVQPLFDAEGFVVSTGDNFLTEKVFGQVSLVMPCEQMTGDQQ